MVKRFQSVDGYAPFTLGAACNVITVDRTVFERPHWQKINRLCRGDVMPSRKRPRLVTIFRGSF